MEAFCVPTPFQKELMEDWRLARNDGKLKMIERLQ